MIIINVKIDSHDNKKITQLIQGYLYSFLPKKEHEGYIHTETKKNFKRTNFDYKLIKHNLTIRFSSIDPELEKNSCYGRD